MFLVIYLFFFLFQQSMSASSRQRILNVMGTFRPAFRSVAQSLTDIDLILVEEAFERLLLVKERNGEYDGGLLNTLHRIMTVYSVPWAYPLVYGVERVRYTKETKNLPRL
jgi:hypothetical protein